MMPRRLLTQVWRLAIAAIAAIGAVTEPAHAHRWQDARTGSGRGVTSRSIDTVFSLGRGALIDLSLPFGDVVVTGWPRDDMRVRAHALSGEMTLHISSATATLRPASDRSNLGGVRYEITVPAGVRIVMRTSSGTLIASNVNGNVEARNVNGNVELNDITGRADIETISGNVSGMRISGGVRVDVTSGNVTLAGAEGEIAVDNTSGSVTLTGIRSESVRVETMSGDVTYQGSVERGGRYVFATHSGTVHLTIPSTADAWVTAATYQGSFDTDFQMPARTTKPADPERRFELRLGNGGARITAETFSGNVIIRRGTPRQQED
jgi:hypothetical protein